MKCKRYSIFLLVGRVSVILVLIISLFFTPLADPTRAEDAGYALAFDGVNDGVQLARTSLIMASTWISTKSVELWVKPEGLASPCYNNNNVAFCEHIFGDKPAWWGITRGVVENQDRIWVFNYNSSTGEDRIGIDYTPGEWVHIALVHDGGILRAYKNGFEIDAVPSEPTGQPDTGAMPILHLGNLIVNSSRSFPFRGQIDEVRIWNIARSTSEINADMQRLLAGDEPGLAAYYQMSDGAGLTLTDDSINTWDGTLYDGDEQLGVPPNGSPPQWVLSNAFDVIQPSVVINQASSQKDPTNTSPIIFDVVFSEPVTGFTSEDVDLSTSSPPGTLNAVVTGNEANYNVTVTGMDGEAKVIASIPGGAVQNASSVGNKISTSTDNHVTFDNIVPTATINQADGQVDPTNASPVNFTVVFSEAVDNFTAEDVTITGVSGPVTVFVTGGPAIYNVAVSGMVSNATVIASIAGGMANDAAGNSNELSASTDNSVTFDNIAPVVTINQADGQADPTNTSPVNFTVVFSEEVDGFTAEDVTITGIAGTVTVEMTGGPTTYNVAVGGMASHETVIASVAARVAQDVASNLNEASASVDNRVTFDHIAPVVTINQADGQADPTNTSPVNFTVVFSEEVDGFTAEDVTITGIAGTVTVDVTGGPTTYNVAVGGMASYGTVIASVAAGVAQDAASNLNEASSSVDNRVTFDHIAPEVTINQADGQADPTSDSPITFTVIFSEEVSSFEAGDVTLSGDAGATTTEVTGDGTTYTVSISGMTSSGSVTAFIPAGVAHDAAGNDNTASTSTDHTVSFIFWDWTFLPLIIR